MDFAVNTITLTRVVHLPKFVLSGTYKKCRIVW